MPPIRYEEGDSGATGYYVDHGVWPLVVERGGDVSDSAVSLASFWQYTVRRIRVSDTCRRRYQTNSRTRTLSENIRHRYQRVTHS